MTFRLDLAEPGASHIPPAVGRGDSAAPAGLGSNTDIITPLYRDLPANLPWSQADEWARPIETDEGNLQQWEAIKWLSLSAARRYCERRGRYHRLMSCGVALNHASRYVSVHRVDGANRAKLKGVCRCGQTICCPVCAPRVSAVRAEEVATGYKHAVGMGYDVLLVTLTIPHRADSTLHDEALFWRATWDWAFAQGGGKNAVAVKRDWLGYINAAEMTHSPAAGWHFHRHLILVVEPGRGDVCAQLMRARWLSAIRRNGRDCPGLDLHAFDAQPCDGPAAAYYCGKIGAELARPTTKASLTPLAILQRDVLAGAPDSPLWYEALAVCSSLKIGAVRWSRNLRSKLELPPERRDAEIAEDVLEARDVLLGFLTPSQWRRIIYQRIEYQFLQVANQGEAAANTFLEAYGLGRIVTENEYKQASTQTSI